YNNTVGIHRAAVRTGRQRGKKQKDEHGKGLVAESSVRSCEVRVLHDDLQCGTRSPESRSRVSSPSSRFVPDSYGSAGARIPSEFGAHSVRRLPARPRHTGVVARGEGRPRRAEGLQAAGDPSVVSAEGPLQGRAPGSDLAEYLC